MSKRVEVLYDDGTTIAFNSADEAVYHLYAQGLAGAVCLREEADWEHIGQLRAARTAMQAAGLDAGSIEEPEPDVLMDRDRLNVIINELRDDSDVPVIVSGSRAESEERLSQIEADNNKALKAARRLVKEA